MTGPMFALISASVLMLALLVESIWRVFRPRPSWRAQPIVFFVLAGLSLLVLRWPSITWTQELNVDESQMLAQGMRYLAHPVPWRDVDGTTSGPLNSLLLSMPISLGAPASWQTARIMLLVLNCLTLLFLYLALRSFGTESEAQFALMPTILFYGFSINQNFVHYSSEAFSVMLLSACIFLLARQWCAAQPSKIRWFLLGLVSGCVPFAKLQAAPLALFLVAVGFVMLFVRQRRADMPKPIGWQEPAALLIGGLVVPFLILAVVIATGAFTDFWTSYILAAKSYASQQPITKRMEYLRIILWDEPGFRYYFLSSVGAIGLGLVAWCAGSAKIPGKLRWPLLMALATGALTLLCLFATGEYYYHYGLLLVPTFGTLIGLVFFAGKTLLAGKTAPGTKGARTPNTSAAFYCWLAALSVFAIGLQSFKAQIYLSAFKAYGSHWRPPPMSTVGQLIRAMSRKEDTLSVWGWTPSYYVETGLIPATRDAIGHYIITDGPYQDFFRKRYLNDLMKVRPPFFIDAVTAQNFHWTWTAEQTHESFPDLSRFIQDNYALWQCVPSTPPADWNVLGYPVRIYVLKERLAELDHLPVMNADPKPHSPAQ